MKTECVSCHHLLMEIYFKLNSLYVCQVSIGKHLQCKIPEVSEEKGESHCHCKAITVGALSSRS